MRGVVGRTAARRSDVDLYVRRPARGDRAMDRPAGTDRVALRILADDPVGAAASVRDAGALGLRGLVTREYPFRRLDDLARARPLDGAPRPRHLRHGPNNSARPDRVADHRR